MNKPHGILYLLLVVSVALLMGCSGGEQSQAGKDKVKLTVAAAADLRFAFEDVIAALNKRHPELEVKATYGSSGNFHAQISNGAPFDLYLSADTAYVESLQANGHVLKDSLFAYARGRIVLWAKQDSRLDVKGLGMNALKDASVKKLAIANPAHAPYGRAAREALQHAGLWEQYEPKLVLGENASQTATYTYQGVVDAGIVPLVLAEAKPMKGGGSYWLVPADMHKPLDQAGGIVAGSKQPREAKLLADFILSKEGQAILQSYGFEPPGK